MKPVAVIRHSRTEGPGHFATFLERHSVPWQLFRIDADDVAPTPSQTDEFSGLCLMGGPMSVNDDLPWIPPLLEFIRSMIDADRPVIGHCLGGQLISKALGGIVTRNPVKEIGWGLVNAVDGPLASRWLGDLQQFESFHWHGETFSIPPGGTRILASAACPNQAYVVGDKHLGMQCHVEMTAEMIHDWCESGAEEIASSLSSATVQTPEQMAENLAHRLAALNHAAEQLYSRWIKGLKTDA
jgi:GMP synthase-like glutamine amidotransferase